MFRKIIFPPIYSIFNDYGSASATYVPDPEYGRNWSVPGAVRDVRALGDQAKVSAKVMARQVHLQKRQGGGRGDNGTSCEA